MAAQGMLDYTLGRIRASRFYTSGDTLNISHFEASQAQWRVYLQQTCDPLADLYGRGDIRYSAPLDCKLIMLRDRQRLLEIIYHSVLYN